MAAVILGVAVLLLFLRLYALERALRGAARQLREMEGSGSSSKLRLATPNSSAEALIAAVNGILELRQADEAGFRRREGAIRRQIANVSHDLRTPLTSILGYLQLLESDSLGQEERMEYLEVVQSRARALQNLISSFYDLSRLDGGEYPLSRERVDLHAVLSELIAGFYHDLTDSGLEMEVDLEEGLPLVWGDPAAIQRIFANLLRNALEHGGGRLFIKLHREGERICVTFRNGAEGLTQADLAHVFDRSFTSDKNRTGGNAGLGLAIVKALTEQMGCEAKAALEDGDFIVSILWNR